MQNASDELQQYREASLEQESLAHQTVTDQSQKISELKILIQQYDLDRDAAEV